MRRLRTVLFPALVLAPVAITLLAAGQSPKAMEAAATQFLSALTPEQRQKAAFAFDAAERTHWHFIPTEMFARNGLTLTEMTPPQREKAHAMLQAGLSQRGNLTARTIIDLENVLAEIEKGGQMRRDPERYFFSVFGTPSERGAWGWRVEGHHISLHFTVVNGRFVQAAPTFFGSNPADVKSGPKAGTRALGSLEDPARALVVALDAGRRGKAVIQPQAPTDIVTMNTLPISPLTPPGLAAAGMTDAQRAMLMRIVEAYTSLMADDIAADRLDGVRKAGVEKVTFAWAGETELGKKHYYRVQGPTFLIEYRQHAERREPRPLGLARFRGRLRTGSPAGAPRHRALTERLATGAGVGDDRHPQIDRTAVAEHADGCRRSDAGVGDHAIELRRDRRCACR